MCGVKGRRIAFIQRGAKPGHAAPCAWYGWPHRQYRTCTVPQEAYLYLLHVLVVVNVIPREPSASLSELSATAPSLTTDAAKARAWGAGLVPSLHRGALGPGHFQGTQSTKRNAHTVPLARRLGSA